MAFRRKGAGVLSLAILGVAATGGYAFTSGFTASNTVSAQDVGAGTATASGYTVTSIRYTFDSSNLANVDYVDFVLDKAADNVKVQLTKTLGVPSGTVYPCDVTNAGGPYTLNGVVVNASATHPVCDLASGTGGVANSGITDLTVAATKTSP